MKVVVASTDLMDRSKLAAALPEAELVRSLEGVEADLVVVDIARPAFVAQLPSVRAARIIGFGPHVDDEAMAAALAAGCTEVLPRSVLFRRLPTLLEPGKP